MRPRSVLIASLMTLVALVGTAVGSPALQDGGKSKGKDKAAKQAKLLKQYDANGNGVLDPDEKARMKKERKAKRKANKAKRKTEAEDPAKKAPPKTDPPKKAPPKKVDPPKGGGGGGR